jgi:hypothetical protein
VEKIRKKLAVICGFLGNFGKVEGRLRDFLQGDLLSISSLQSLLFGQSLYSGVDT